MPACHDSRPRPVLRRFIVADYLPGADGVLEARLPDVGPCHDRDDQRCDIRRDYLRARSTGPCFPVSVLVCVTHDLGFTVYPPGHVPYGRAAVAPVGLDGTEAARGADSFAGTLLDATLDAAKGEAWHRECAGGSSTWWSTQGRQVTAGARLCGVLPDLGDAGRQAQAAALWVDTLLLLQGAHSIAAAPGYRSRGQAAVAVLEALAPGPSVLRRVLAAGHLAGLWGAPYRWDAGVRQLRSWAFPGGGTHPP